MHLSESVIKAQVNLIGRMGWASVLYRSCVRHFVLYINMYVEEVCFFPSGCPYAFFFLSLYYNLWFLDILEKRKRNADDIILTVYLKKTQNLDQSKQNDKI